MPVDSIMNFMQQGAPPLLSEQIDDRNIRQGQGYSAIKNNMLMAEGKQMAIDKENEKDNLLKSFEGDFDSKEFYDEMMKVDPKMAITMREKLAKIGSEKATAATGKAVEMAKFAMQDNTEEAWNARGWPVPFEKRQDIITMGMTMQQAMSNESENYSRTTVKPSKKTLSDRKGELSKWLAENMDKKGTPEYANNMEEYQRARGADERTMMKDQIIGGYGSGGQAPAQTSNAPAKPAPDIMNKYKGAW